MVGLDDCGLAAETALDYVRVDCSLRKEVNGTYFLSFFLKYTDKFFTDYLSLLLRFCYSCEFAEGRGQRTRR